MTERYKPKFFPFSAGIPWKIERGKYILPDVDLETWNKVLDKKDIIITAFGGMIESFFSLSFAEALHSFDPGHKVYWLGDPKYHLFARSQGLCKLCNINLTPDKLKDYPVPLFFDRKDNAYLNALVNYKVRRAYWGKYPEERSEPALQQIFQNCMVPWRDYRPAMRRLGTEFWDELIQTGRVRKTTKVITIIIDHTDDDSLEWNVQNIREFAQLVGVQGIRVVVFSGNSRVFHGTSILAHEFDMRKVLQLIPHSWMVLSNKQDWLLISMLISKAHIISKHIDGCYDLFKNAEVLGVQNDIFTDREWVSPMDAHTICEGLL